MASKSKSRGSGGRGSNRPANTGNLDHRVFREFSDDPDDLEEMDQWGYAHYSQYERGLLSWEQRAINYYVESSWDINGGMRTGDWNSDSARRTAETLRTAIDKSRVPDSIIAYRGFDNGDTKFKLEVGGVISDKGFGSTSLSRRVAYNEFSGGEHADTGVLMRVYVPRGSKGVYTNATRTEANRFEQELLLQAGSKYRIRGVRREKSGFTYLDVDLIQ